MRRTKTLVAIMLLAVLCTVVCGCKGKNGGKEGLRDVKIERFENVMLSTPDDQLAAALTKFRDEHPTPLLRIFPDDAQYMDIVHQFRTQPEILDLYAAVKSRYADLGWLEKSLSEALAKACELDTNIRYKQFITYIGSEGYENRVKADRESGSVVIVIDQYVIGDMAKYGYFGDPQYIVSLSDSLHLATDVMSTIYRQHVVCPQDEMTLLDYMIAEGKVQYMLELTMPSEADSVRMRYTTQQLQWATANEGSIWAYFAQKQLLFEKDFSVIRNFVGDAPKTNAFTNSAPRTTAFVGWHIVREYMKKNSHVSVAELLEEADAQKILNGSHYRPTH